MGVGVVKTGKFGAYELVVIDEAVGAVCGVNAPADAG